MRIALALLLSALGATAAPTAPVFAAERPTLFASLSHEQAMQQARDQDRLLLIDFTATWCAPCKKMDRTTWVDPDVVDWVGEHAVAIQVDVDEQKDVSRAYKVSAMPTIVAVRDGLEVDRVVGYRKGKRLLSWLADVEQGRTTLDSLSEVDEHDVGGRYALAQELMNRSKDALATEQLLWLWRHAVEYEPSFVGVRSSFMASLIGRLAKRHEPARTRFGQILDEDRAALDGGSTDSGLMGDWITLCKTLGRSDELLEWIEARVDAQGRLQDVPQAMLGQLADVLVEAGRLAQAGRIYPDLLDTARQQVDRAKQTLGMMRGSDRVDDEMLASMISFNHERVFRFYQLALAAERLDDAELIEDLLLDYEDSPAMRLDIVREAVANGATQPRHARLAAEALAHSEDEADRVLAEGLIEQIAQALEADGN